MHDFVCFKASFVTILINVCRFVVRQQKQFSWPKAGGAGLVPFFLFPLATANLVQRGLVKEYTRIPESERTPFQKKAVQLSKMRPVKRDA